MEVLKKKMVLPSLKYYEKHLSIINPMLTVQLTVKEIQVLASFLSVGKEMASDYRFNSVAKKHVRTALKLKPGGLSNYFRSMVNKKVLLKNEITGAYTIAPHVLPEEKQQAYTFLIVKDE